MGLCLAVIGCERMLGMKQYEIFTACLEHMKEIYEYEPPYNCVILAGIVGLFRHCFDQAWKLMQAILTAQGFVEAQTGSLKQILKLVYSAGMITDEALWLEALQARNNVAHSYNELIALEIVRGAKERYYDMFCTLKAEIEKNWLDQ